LLFVFDQCRTALPFAFGVAVGAEPGWAGPTGPRRFLIAVGGELLTDAAGVGLPGQPGGLGTGGEGTPRGGVLCRVRAGSGLPSAVQGSTVGIDVVLHAGSSFSIDRDTPALSLSLHAIEESGDDVVASAMMCAWAWSAAVIDGHAASGQRRNVIQIQDELRRALRAAPGLVERSDRITRLNRHRGAVSVQSTHSITDLEALPTEADRAKAKDMAARNDIKLLGGMDNAEMNRSRESTRSNHRPHSPGRRSRLCRGLGSKRG